MVEPAEKESETGGGEKSAVSDKVEDSDKMTESVESIPIEDECKLELRPLVTVSARFTGAPFNKATLKTYFPRNRYYLFHLPLHFIF